MLNAVVLAVDMHPKGVFPPVIFPAVEKGAQGYESETTDAVPALILAFAPR